MECAREFWDSWKSCRDALTVTIACLVAPKLPGLLVSTEIKSSKRIRDDLVCVTLTAGPAE